MPLRDHHVGDLLGNPDRATWSSSEDFRNVLENAFLLIDRFHVADEAVMIERAACEFLELGDEGFELRHHEIEPVAPVKRFPVTPGKPPPFRMRVRHSWRGNEKERRPRSFRPERKDLLMIVGALACAQDGRFRQASPWLPLGISLEFRDE